MNSKKILLFGPISDFGGRELESGFIASVLSSKYEVVICSTGKITSNSQVFDFIKKQKVLSVKELLVQNFFFLKLLAFFSFFKNGCKGKVSEYANNAFAKRFLNYDKKIQIVLNNLMSDYDAVFVIAQLSSNLIDFMIRIAKNKNKKVLFRTTGTITTSEYNFINSVDCFIHHSQKNAEQLAMHKHHKFIIIDQCAYSEIDLQKIQPTNGEIFKFLILSRLSPEKGVEEIINFFLKVCSEKDVLIIAGTGELENELKNKFKESNKIIFQGFVNGSNLSELFCSIDCLIIPSPEESGPLVGIESMCAGKMVISTKVGAMHERMQGTLNDYWFDYGDFESFKEVFFEVKKLNQIQVKTGSVTLRERYNKEYSINRISEKYLKIVEEVLDTDE